MAYENTKELKVLERFAEGAVLFTNGMIRLSGRFTYAYCGQPQSQENDEGKTVESWSCGLLMPKKTHKAPKDLCVRRINELLVENKVKALPADKKFIKDGDLSDKPEYEGMWVVSSRAYEQPTLIDPATNVVPSGRKARDLFYGGAYGSLLLRPWFQSHKQYGKRVNASLSGVQFLKHGDPFGEGRLSEEAIAGGFDAGEDAGGWDSGSNDDDKL